MCKHNISISVGNLESTYRVNNISVVTRGFIGMGPTGYMCPWKKISKCTYFQHFLIYLLEGRYI